MTDKYLRRWIIDNLILKDNINVRWNSSKFLSPVGQQCLSRLEKYDIRYSIVQRIKLFLSGAEEANCIECGKICGYGNTFCSSACVSRNNNVKLKSRKTCLEKYGVDNFAKSNLFKSQAENTCLKKYGVTNAAKSKDIRDKISFGIGKSKRLAVDERFPESWWDVDYLQSLVDEGGLSAICDVFGVSKSYAGCQSRHLGIEYHCVSYPEKSIQKFIMSLGINTLINVRSIISPLELDVVVPEKKIAIEMDGVYWHSEISGGKDKNYHLNKTKQCEAKGYQLFHVFDNEWHDKKEIWKSVLANALGFCDKKIGARQCKIIELSYHQSTDFLNHNHLQGSCQSKIRYGLEFNGELVSLMTFGKSRFSKKYDWELIRFCSKLDTVIVGGASKLLSHFRKHHPGSIVSYANRRWSTGHLYERLGFARSHASSPNYFYMGGGYIGLQSRNKFQKHKLYGIIQTFNPNLTEWQNMMANGFDRIWDCGNIVYHLEEDN